MLLFCMVRENLYTYLGIFCRDWRKIVENEYTPEVQYLGTMTLRTKYVGFRRNLIVNPTIGNVSSESGKETDRL